MGIHCQLVAYTAGILQERTGRSVKEISTAVGQGRVTQSEPKKRRGKQPACSKSFPPLNAR